MLSWPSDPGWCQSCLGGAVGWRLTGNRELVCLVLAPGLDDMDVKGYLGLLESLYGQGNTTRASPKVTYLCDVRLSLQRVGVDAFRTFAAVPVALSATPPTKILSGLPQPQVGTIYRSALRKTIYHRGRDQTTYTAFVLFESALSWLTTSSPVSAFLVKIRLSGELSSGRLCR